MSMSGLVGETFIQSELDYHRERAMQQYNRRHHRQHKWHLAWPLTRQQPGQHHRRPAVS